VQSDDQGRRREYRRKLRSIRAGQHNNSKVSMGVLEAPFFVSPLPHHAPGEHNAQNREIAAYSDYRPQERHLPVCALGSISTHNAKRNAKDAGTRRNLRD
jgi:hypothetical protein